MSNSQNQQPDRPWLKYWIAKWKADPTYGVVRFKKLNCGYPNFEMDKDLYDEVDLEEFVRIEADRIPLFIGTQCGIHPNMKNIPGFLFEERQIALLGKSILSGCVAGVGVYRLGRNDINFSCQSDRKIKYFYN